MANIYQGEIATDGSTNIVATKISTFVTTIIITNITDPYSFTLYRVSKLDTKNPIALYQFTLDAGDTIRDSQSYILNEGDWKDYDKLSKKIQYHSNETHRKEKNQKDLEKMGMALAKLSEEDPTFRAKYDDETGQTVISGMGELHLEIIIDRMRREFKVELNQGAPQVNYKEALKTTVTHREKLKKQTGGSGLFADMEFELGPADEDFLNSDDFKSGKTKLQFKWDIVGGSIDRNYQKPIIEGFTQMMNNGILAGYNIDSMKVRVFDGSMHAVDSKPIAFELCAKEGFREAAPKCNPIILEPIMKLEVITPEEYVGGVIGDLNRRRGLPKGQETKLSGTVIKAEVPLSEMFGYVTQLRTITSGRASSTMEFDHFSQVPNNVAKEIMEAAKGKKGS
jgi:elongation factor G